MKKSIALIIALFPLLLSAQQIITGKEFRYTPKDSLKFRTITNDSFFLYVDPLTGRFHRTLPPGATPVKVDSVTFNSSSTVDTVKYWINGTGFVAGMIDIKNGLISGGLVSWNSGLTFDISPAVYRIANVRYTSPQSSITLDAADPSNPRIDVIGLDAAGVIKVTGTPAASPAKPQVDIASEIELTNVLINAGATSPGGVTRTVVYDENTEWTSAANIFSGSVDFDNTVNPFNGSKAARFASGTNGSISWTNSTPVNISDYSLLKLYVYIPTAGDYVFGVSLNSGSSYGTISLRLSDYGFNPAVGGSYQVVTIPLADFAFAQTTFDNITIKTITTPGTADIDYVQLQGGISTPGGSPYLTDVFRKSGTDSIFKKINGVNSLAFLDNNEMDFFLLAGHSQVRGRGEDSAASPNPLPGTVYEFYANALHELNNEIHGNITIDGDRQDANISSPWPSFGITYHNITGRKICFVQTAKSGAGIMLATPPTVGVDPKYNWGDGGLLRDSAIYYTNLARAAIAAQGYTPVFKGIIWGEGTTEAFAINDAVITGQQYEDSTLYVFSKFREAFGQDMPIYIWKEATHLVEPDVPGFRDVRNHQDSIAFADPLRNIIVFSMGEEFKDRGMFRDNVHFNTAAANETGRVIAVNTISYSGRYFQPDGTGALTHKLWDVNIKKNLYVPKVIGGKNTTDSLTFQTTSGVGTTTADIVFRVGNNGATNALRILNNGRIGFNTSAPARLWEFSTSSTNNGLSVRSNNTSNYAFIETGRTGGDLIISSGTNAAGNFFLNTAIGDVSFRAISGMLHLGVAPTPTENSTMILSGSPYRVGIGTVSGAVSSAKLEVASTTMGFLPPRMTTAQKTAISTPANGLELFDTDLGSKSVYTSGQWQESATTSATKNGTATLSGGTVTVNTTAIKSGSIVLVVHNTISGTQGILSVPAGSYVAATSFVINSSDAGDNSTVNWWIIN